jgi:hypothetical protein
VKAALGELDGGLGDKVAAILNTDGRLEVIVDELVTRVKAKEEKEARRKVRVCGCVALLPGERERERERESEREGRPAPPPHSAHSR